MNIRQLNIFLDLANTLNTTKTAKNLYIAQPSISLAIKELEEELNIKLFTRFKQRLILTREGKELVRYVQVLMNDFDSLKNIANIMRNKPSLNLACSLSVGENLLAKCISDYSNDDINLHIDIVLSDKVIDGILNGNYDCGIIEKEINYNEVKKIKIKEDRISIIAKKDYLINDNIDIRDLANYPLILRDKYSSTRTFLDNILINNNLDINPLCESSTNEGVIDFVLKGLGIGVISNIAIKDLIANNEVKEIKINDLDLKRNIYLIILKNKVLNSKIEGFINYLINEINNV